MFACSMIRACRYSTSTVPVITVPKYLDASLRRAERKSQQDIQKLFEERGRGGNRQIPVIICKRDHRLNMFYGQTYPKPKKRGQEPKIPLVTAGWMRGIKYRNDELVLVSYAKNPKFIQLEKEKYELESEEVYFEQLHLDPLLVSTLASLKMEKASLIQSRAIPLILSGNNCVVAAETGCGKTVAYMAPLVQLLAAEKSSDPYANRNRSYDDVKQPRAIIVVPTRELVEQIADVGKNLGAPLGVGVAAMTGGLPREVKHSGYDIIVTTLGLMHRHISKAYNLTKVKHLVVDEADTLLDDSFSPELLEVMSRMHFKSKNDASGVQLVLVSATVPREIEKILGDQVDMESIEVASTPRLHQVPAHVTQRFIRIDRKDRDAALLQLCSRYEAAHEPCIIFCNRTPMSNWVAGYLRENGINCLRLNKTLGEYERLDQLKRFQSGDCDFISSTDLGSRGLDTTRAKNIINFDCPAYIADYIHRVGRIGRLGSSSHGNVTTFVSYKPAVAMVQKLEQAVRMGKSLEEMDANIKKQIRNSHQQKIARFSALRSGTP